MHIKCVSLNLWQGGKLLPGILEFLAEQDADIVLLQEVYDSREPSFPDNYRSMEILRRELRYPYDCFSPSMIDKLKEGKVVAGNAILSRLPILATEVTYMREVFGERDPYDPAEFPTCPRILQHATLLSPVGELHIFNLHGVWDLDGDNYGERRRQMADKVIAAVKGKHRVILAGDTNSRPTNQAMRRIEKVLPSVFGTELTSTFNMRHKEDPGYATSAVDLMYVSSDLKVISKDCPDVDISDHRPIIVTLELRSLVA